MVTSFRWLKHVERLSEGKAVCTGRSSHRVHAHATELSGRKSLNPGLSPPEGFVNCWGALRIERSKCSGLAQGPSLQLWRWRGRQAGSIRSFCSAASVDDAGLTVRPAAEPAPPRRAAGPRPASAGLSRGRGWGNPARRSGLGTDRSLPWLSAGSVADIRTHVSSRTPRGAPHRGGSACARRLRGRHAPITARATPPTPPGPTEPGSRRRMRGLRPSAEAHAQPRGRGFRPAGRGLWRAVGGAWTVTPTPTRSRLVSVAATPRYGPARVPDGASR